MKDTHKAATQTAKPSANVLKTGGFAFVAPDDVRAKRLIIVGAVGHGGSLRPMVRPTETYACACSLSAPCGELLEGDKWRANAS